MRIRHVFCSIFVILGLWSSQIDAQTLYTKTVSLPPLRISFSDLQAMLEKSNVLLNSANGSISTLREEVVLGANNLRVHIDGHKLDPSGAKIPKYIDFFSYSYVAKGDAPISSVSLDLADYDRTLSVQGQSPDQVDALAAALGQDLTALSTPIGGAAIKSLLGFSLYTILLWVGVGFSFHWFYTRRNIFLLPPFATIGIYVVTRIVPFDQLLAGFSATDGDPAFIVRYGAQIGFWVGVGPIAFSFLWYLIRTFRSKKIAVVDKEG
ncbi:hypothetical protein ACIPF8_18810 [Collimonas sp. NPDC087041]|uniref:hypothetical protein n=1 Tax=Collimonas sp. NPDC087041 TaxID=3363960 RepID=UPI0038042B5D